MTTTDGATNSAVAEPSGAGRIVVGVDGSDTSLTALAWALRQAKFTGLGVDAVITWSIPTAAAVSGALPDTFNPAGDAEQALSEAVGPLRTANADVDLRTIEIEGAAGPSLVDYASKADVLVVGSRGHGFVAGLLLGSVSEYCVSHAHCPVLVLRVPAGE